MRQSTALALLSLLGVACATDHGGPGEARPPSPPLAPGQPHPAAPSLASLGARLVSRAEEDLGRAGPFLVDGERFPADCSGYVASVYQAEGIPLRRLEAQVAPDETSGVAAAYRAVRAYGVVFGGGGEWPRPGDLVFFHDTFDRNRNGLLDDPFTHMGIVERVEDGSVTFLHRGGKAVVRATLTLERPDLRRDGDGRERNTVLRDKQPRIAGAPALAGELFMAYGRIDPERVARGSR